MSVVYLKVKICSLAAEGAIIHRMEHRWKKRWRSDKDETFFGLQGHRKAEVRPEQRAAMLAYGFLRGRAYRSIEFKCYEPPNWLRVAELVRKYGPPVAKESAALAIKAWAEIDPLQRVA